MTSFYWVYLLAALPSSVIIWQQGRQWHPSIWLLLLLTTLLSIATATVKNNEEIHLISWFSIFLFILFYLGMKSKSKSAEYINPALMFSGSFLSMFIADLLTSLLYIPHFQFQGIGGAGIKDGLVIVPYFSLFMSSIILLVFERNGQVTETI